MRRIIALIVLSLAGYAGVHHASFGMLGPVVVLGALVVAILAGAVVVFNLRFARPGRALDREDRRPTPFDLGLGKVGLLIFAVAPLLIAVKGIYLGRLPAFGSGPDIALSQNPAAFFFTFSAWVAIGLAAMWLLRKVASTARTDEGYSDADSDEN